MKKKKIINVLLILSITILLSSIFIFLFYHYKNVNNPNITNNKIIEQQNENQKLIEEQNELTKRIEELKNDKKEELEELKVWEKAKERLS